MTFLSEGEITGASAVTMYFNPENGWLNKGADFTRSTSENHGLAAIYKTDMQLIIVKRNNAIFAVWEAVDCPVTNPVSHES